MSKNSVADPNPDSGSESRIPKLGSRILDHGSLTHIFESSVTNFLGKKYYNSLSIDSQFFMCLFKIK